MSKSKGIQSKQSLAPDVMRDTAIKDRRPSVTNSAWASYRLEQLGLGVDPIAEVIKRGLKATLHCYSKDGALVDTRPDYRTQLEAAKLLTEIHGFRHVPEQKIDISKTDITIIQEIRTYETRELAERERDSLEVVNRAKKFTQILP